MIISARVDYFDGSWKALTDEQYAELREVIAGLPKNREEFCHSTFLIDDEGMRLLARHGLNIRLEDGPAADNINTMLVKLQNRVEELTLDQRRDLPKLASAGALVQIAIPDMPLMYVNEIIVETSCCTDIIQDRLNDGWRILAVCPPNAQRRPDYILGRRKVA